MGLEVRNRYLFRTSICEELEMKFFMKKPFQIGSQGEKLFTLEHISTSLSFQSW